MKQLRVTLTLLVLFLAACGGTPAPTVETTVTPVIFATQTIPPTTTATVAPFLFRDDFEGTLAAGWSWIGEDPTHWNLTEVPGSMRIILQPSNMNDGEPKNFLVREAPNENFEIATLAHFAPTSNFQFAGLLIYQSQGSAFQFGRSFAQCQFEAFCAGNAIYFDIMEGGAGGKPNFVTSVTSESQAFLRLQRKGTSYTGYYSEDGTDWIIIGTHESNIKPQFVGLIASQAYEAETTADFDYFTIEVLP